MAESISLIGVERAPDEAGAERVALITDRGRVDCRLHSSKGDGAILWVFGAGGGLGGPAGGLYTRLGSHFRARGIASLELAYRRPGNLAECVADVLVGLAWLEHEGKSRVVLVGHSFGGAVVINAAVLSERVVAVAALSSQTAGTAPVSRIAPRPTLFMHGEADEILPDRCSHDLYARAGEPKELILYPGCRHGLDQCRDALDRDLGAWLDRVFGPRAQA